MSLGSTVATSAVVLAIGLDLKTMFLQKRMTCTKKKTRKENYLGCFLPPSWVWPPHLNVGVGSVISSPGQHSHQYHDKPLLLHAEESWKYRADGHTPSGTVLKRTLQLDWEMETRVEGTGQELVGSQQISFEPGLPGGSWCCPILRHICVTLHHPYGLLVHSKIWECGLYCMDKG